MLQQFLFRFVIRQGTSNLVSTFKLVNGLTRLFDDAFDGLLVSRIQRRRSHLLQCLVQFGGICFIRRQIVCQPDGGCIGEQLVCQVLRFGDFHSSVRDLPKRRFHLRQFEDESGDHVGLPGMDPAQRFAIWDELNRVIALLHSVDYRAVGLEDFGRAGSYIERQIARWSKQYRASETEKIEAMDNLIAWLPANIPPGDETTIVHGDYRLDNTIFHPSEPRILAVLDWELSTLGHPLADFSYHCMSWHIPAGKFRGIEGLPIAELGIPSEQRYIEMYCKRTGRKGIDPSTWDFYMAYNLFRIAGITQGIAKRVLDGTAASAHAVEAGSKAPLLAGLGWQQVEKILKRAA